MSTYSGCIIDESIKNKSILDEFKIIDKSDDDGAIYIVEIDDSKINDIVPKVMHAMVEEKVWYCDLKNYDYHYIIYNDKVFKVNRDYGEQYEEAKKYGLKRGIPECQLPNKTWAK